jgi:hypothetical protein
MTTDLWTETFIEDFTEEDIKEFQEIVLRDVRNKCYNIKEKQILRENLDLWLFSLRVVRKDTELKLAQIKTNKKIKLSEMKLNNASQKEIEEFLIVEDSRRNNTIKFLTHVEQKTLYVKLLLQDETEN